MSISVSDLSRMQTQKEAAEASSKPDLRTEEAKLQFAGMIINTLMEEVMPKEMGWDDNGNGQLFMGLYVQELLQEPHIIKDFGLHSAINPITPPPINPYHPSTSTSNWISAA